MIPFVTIQGRKFDIVEQFDDYLVVQDLVTRSIYSVKTCFLDFHPDLTDTVEEKNNIVSMFWYKLDKAAKKEKENGEKNKN